MEVDNDFAFYFIAVVLHISYTDSLYVLAVYRMRKFCGAWGKKDSEICSVLVKFLVYTSLIYS